MTFISYIIWTPFFNLQNIHLLQISVLIAQLWFAEFNFEVEIGLKTRGVEEVRVLLFRKIYPFFVFISISSYSSFLRKSVSSGGSILNR